MFGSKRKRDKLEARYKVLMEEAYRLSHSDRKKGDEKLAEAEKVRLQLEELEKAEA